MPSSSAHRGTARSGSTSTGCRPAARSSSSAATVDRAGAGTPAPNSAVVASRGATALANDPEMTVPAGDCFVRLQVVTSSGAVVAFGQPIWLLAAAPAGVPPARVLAG